MINPININIKISFVSFEFTFGITKLSVNNLFINIFLHFLQLNTLFINSSQDKSFFLISGNTSSVFISEYTVSISFSNVFLSIGSKVS